MQMSTHAACLSAARSACVWASHPPRHAEAIARWCHCCACSCDLLRVVGELQPRALLRQQAAHATSFAAIFALVPIMATSSHLAGSSDRPAPPCKELIPHGSLSADRIYTCLAHVDRMSLLCGGCARVQAPHAALSAALASRPHTAQNPHSAHLLNFASSNMNQNCASTCVLLITYKLICYH